MWFGEGGWSVAKADTLCYPSAITPKGAKGAESRGERNLMIVDSFIILFPPS